MTKEVSSRKEERATVELPSSKVQNVAKVTEQPKEVRILKMMEKFRPEASKTADEKIERSKQFAALSERYGFLKNKYNDLKMFHAGNDKTNAKIIFKNAQDFEFEIRNSTVINKIIEATQEELNILVLEAENEVMTFEM